jgi:hypothetical protein
MSLRADRKAQSQLSGIDGIKESNVVFKGLF